MSGMYRNLVDSQSALELDVVLLVLSYMKSCTPWGFSTPVLVTTETHTLSLYRKISCLVNMGNVIHDIVDYF